VSAVESIPEDAASLRRAALVIAHPGHELRAYGWAEQSQPLTFVLTRGDGSHGVSRLTSTTRILSEIGATPGCIYGRFSDAELYDTLLRQDHEVLLAVRDELADALVAGGISQVVCDAEEGYNPSHDVCRYLAAAAVRSASRRANRPISLFDIPLIGPPDTCDEALRPAAIRLELDDDTFARKLRCANHYPELQDEVDRALAANGAEAFRIECLRPAVPGHGRPPGRPFYEQYGDEQVRAGRYSEVIRFEPHVRGIRDALTGSPETEA